MKIFRMWDWLLMTAIWVALIYWIAPQQAPVMMWKLCLVSLATCITYWVDRSLFKRARDRIGGGSTNVQSVDTDRDLYSSLCMVRRALIFLGVVLGLSLGV